MDFSGIPAKSLVGKVLRLPLRLLPGRMKMPIMQGKLRGKKWVVGSSSHGCWLGSYEYDKQRLFSETVTPGSVVYDVGGHVGFYALLASELVGPDGRVFSFEPIQRNLQYLREHIEVNKANNVTVIAAAVSEESGTAKFNEGPSSMMGHIDTGGTIEVKVVALDELCSTEELPPPDFIKMDIEGAEFMALKGAKDILTQQRPTIFLATHGETVHEQCCEFLRSLGYQLTPIDGNELSRSSEVLAVHP